MQNQVFNVYNEMVQDNFETLRRLGEINMRTGERLVEQQLELTNTMIESGAKSMEMFSKARGYQELLNTAKLGQDAGEQYMKTYRNTVEVLAEARDSMADVIEKQMESAQKKAKEAGDSAAQMMDEQMQKAQAAGEQMKKGTEAANEEARKGAESATEKAAGRK